MNVHGNRQKPPERPCIGLALRRARTLRLDPTRARNGAGGGGGQSWLHSRGQVDEQRPAKIRERVRPPPLPTVAPTRVPTVHSLPPYCCPYPCPYCTLPPSLLLPLPVSLLYTPSLPTVAPTRVPTVHSLSLPPPLPYCPRASPGVARTAAPRPATAPRHTPNPTPARREGVSVQ